MTGTITEQIQARLAAIEAEHDVRILFAVESGSRAWGFASPDSDYDIRFVFAYTLDTYLRLDRPRDVIEAMDGDLDFAGWDIYKACGLLRKTNPALIEWLASPIIYRDGEIRESLAELAAMGYHSPMAIHFHYLKMAEANYRQYIQHPTERGEPVLTKKYLYVARPLCAILYFERHHVFPPVVFREVLAGLDLPPEVREALDAILLYKRSGMELGRGPSHRGFNAWMGAEMARLDAAIPAPAKHPELTGPLNVVIWKALHKGGTL